MLHKVLVAAVLLGCSAFVCAEGVSAEGVQVSSNTTEELKRVLKYEVVEEKGVTIYKEVVLSGKADKPGTVISALIASRGEDCEISYQVLGQPRTFTFNKDDEKNVIQLETHDINSVSESGRCKDMEPKIAMVRSMQVTGVKP